MRRVCPECRTPLSRRARFCPKCGMRVLQRDLGAAIAVACAVAALIAAMFLVLA